MKHNNLPSAEQEKFLVSFVQRRDKCGSGPGHPQISKLRQVFNLKISTDQQLWKGQTTKEFYRRWPWASTSLCMPLREKGWGRREGTALGYTGKKKK